MTCAGRTAVGRRHSIAAAAMSAAAAIAADAHHVDPANSLLPEWTGLLGV